MGLSVAWLAVRGVPFGVAMERLGLALTGETSEIFEAPVAGRVIPDGWSLVVARGCDDRIIAEGQLAALSSDCEVVACSLEEHVMYSSAELWSAGGRQWRVAHDAQQGIDHVETAGVLPDDFTPTRAQLAEQQEAEGGKEADVDFTFDLPLLLAQSRVGFKHDEVNAFDNDGMFQVLADSGKVPPGVRPKTWWRFWE